MSVFYIINETEKYRQKIVWDYSEINYIHPFLISALAVYKDSMQGLVDEINVSNELTSILRSISFQEPLEFSNTKCPNEIIEYYNINHQIPICKFRKDYSQIDQMQTAFLSVIKEQIQQRIADNQYTTAVSYLISELICNIQEHSKASYGYMFAQAPRLDSNLYLCIADNGITIHGCYMSTAKQEYLKVIGQDQAEAIRYSTKGVSTKNRPGNESRGYGISTNLNMIINGLNGEFLILSGGAFFKSDKDKEQFVNLPEPMNWDGTIILVKIPLQHIDGFNVYNYIE